MLEMKVMRLLTFMLVIFTASVTSQNVNNSEFIQLDGDSRAILGSGVNPNDLPIAKCKFYSDDPANTNCQLVTRDGDRCRVTFFGDIETKVVSPYQLPGKKMLLHARRSWQGERYPMSQDNLTLVDMSRCTRVYNVSLPMKAQRVFPYEDGSYDVLLQDKEGRLEDHLRLDHYDASGQLAGESVNVSMDWQQTKVQPASTKSSGRGVFVRGRSVMGDGPAGFKFINGSQVKDVLKLNSRMQLVSHLDNDRYYTVCGQSRDSWEKIVCAKYDLQTEKVFEAQFNWVQFDETRHVRGSNSGIVLVGIKEDNLEIKKIIVADAHEGEQPNYWRFDPPWKVATVRDNCRLRNFDDAARSLTLACETELPKRGVTLYKLSSKV